MSSMLKFKVESTDALRTVQHHGVVTDDARDAAIVALQRRYREPDAVVQVRPSMGMGTSDYQRGRFEVWFEGGKAPAYEGWYVARGVETDEG